MTITPVSETTFLISFGQTITPKVADTIAAALPIIRQVMGNSLIDMIPSYSSILIEFDNGIMAMTSCIHALDQQLSRDNELGTTAPNQDTLEIPVYYGEDVALDQHAICTHTGLSFEDIVRLHTQQTYRVYALGFLPGFAYLGQLDDRLTIPRKTSPSFRIPKGSVAIADQQTAVYPKASPGGWHVIGRTPVDLIDYQRQTLTLFTPAAKVRFVPISQATFLAMGGQLDSSLVEGTRC
ncbi:5-oxoprolinase subunit PxpB [Vibrio zhugei]|uniref:5-oxoprolinase subunit PxpB n=1 Tax=Vibrio zhugei TaxID=2479546 RepID=A0ABV7CBC1_9VIBR|nr:5-oxoprolinase subunit PxpB [Vibrio zhugei]